jgi:hypothetical protein
MLDEGARGKFSHLLRLHPSEKSFSYPLNRRRARTESRYGSFGEETSLLSLLGIATLIVYPVDGSLTIKGIKDA